MIITIFGLPGTGKTTFAQRLSTQLDAPHLSTDAIRNREGMLGLYDSSSRISIYQLMLNEAEELLAMRKTVILDATFSQRHLRQAVAMLATRLNRPLRLIELRAAEPLIRQRMLEQRGFSEADFAVYLRLKQSYEPLEQPHLVLDSGQLDLDAMLHTALTYLHIPTGAPPASSRY